MLPLLELGIVGLAHALAAAKRGLKVAVFERNPDAVGASIRNFGMIWPIGQPAGILLDRALKSRQIWTEVAAAAGIAIDPCGSLHLAYRSDEMAVLQEFFDTRSADDTIRLLSASEVADKRSVVVMNGLLGALWSATEMTVDPREAIRQLPVYLTSAYGVEFHFSQVVTEIAYPHFKAGGKD
jgi:D-hydroxyproline dehydrogenase subunit beta